MPILVLSLLRPLPILCDTKVICKVRIFVSQYAHAM